MRRIALLVTYGDRVDLLKKSIEPLTDNYFDKILIVSNGCDKNVIEKLQELSSDDKRIIIYCLEENLGSAGGFSLGLKYAFESLGSDEVLILDDDNYASTEDLSHFFYVKGQYELNNINSKACFSFMRKDRPHYLRFLHSGKEEDIIGTNNSFVSFSVKDKLRKLVSSSKKIDTNNLVKQSDYKIVPVSPYGGLLINKYVVDQVGYPSSTFYLYFDDTEYTYRITQAGFDINMIMNASIQDLETSWNFVKTGFFSSSVLETDESRTKYYFRNRVYFELTYRVNNYVSYAFNISIYVIVLFIKAVISNKVGVFINVCGSIKGGYLLWKRKR